MNYTKRILVLLLAVLMVATLAACGKDKEQSKDPQTAIAEGVKKLEEAGSYRLTFSQETTAGNDGYLTSYTYNVKKGDGASIYYEEYMKFTSDGQTNEAVRDKGYIVGNNAYMMNYNAPDRWISDAPIDFSTILAETCGATIHTGDASPLAIFSKMNPTATENSDGSVTYALKNTTAENFVAVYGLFKAGTVEQLQAIIGDQTQLNITVTIDNEGYFSKLEMAILAAKTSEGTQDGIITITVDKINGFSSINIPDFVFNYVPVDYSKVIHIQNGTKAHYRYNATASNYQAGYNNFVEVPVGFIFVGFGDKKADNYTVKNYEILSDVEGFPVVAVTNVLNNDMCDVKVESLVIPKGISVLLSGYYGDNGFVNRAKDTVLFFKDSEADVDKYFLIPGETAQHEEDIFIAGAYYAGQWDYADGIPAPKK